VSLYSFVEPKGRKRRGKKSFLRRGGLLESRKKAEAPDPARNKENRRLDRVGGECF